MPSAVDLMDRLARLECQNATYLSRDPSLVMARAKGCTIWDTEDKAYVDLCAGFGVHALGHNPDDFHPVWSAQAEERPPIAHAMGDVYPSGDKIELLEELLDCTPKHLSLAALALSGSQAIEIAMKTAMLATSRCGFIVFEGGYHGMDFGALSLSAREEFRAPFRSWLNEQYVEFVAFGGDSIESSLDVALENLRSRGCEVAGVLVEPVQGRGGGRFAGWSWLEAVRRWSDKASALLIFDEIFCGLGRCGRWSFSDRVKADLVCFGKALGGGLPMSACLGSEETMGAWPLNEGEALHTGTFFGLPLACRLGAITLRAIRDQGLCERAQRIGAESGSLLRERLRASADVVEVRNFGLMLVIEFRRRGGGAMLMDRLRAKGIVTLPCGEFGECLSLTPPLNIDETVLKTNLNVVCDEILERL